MRPIHILISFLIAAFLCISCETDSQPTYIEAPDEDAVTLEKGDWWKKGHDRLLNKFLTSMNSGDLDGFMECIWNSPDFIFVSQDGKVSRGWDNMRANVEGLMNSTEWRNLSVDEISRFKFRGVIYSVGLATWEFQVKNGPHVKFQEVWTDAAQWVDGRWVFTVDHAHDLTPFL